MCPKDSYDTLATAGGFLAEEELRLVASSIDDDFLEENSWVIGSEGKEVRVLRCIDRQSDDRLYDTTGYGGIEHRVDILLILIQTTIEIDALGLAAIKRYLISKPSLVEIVESRLYDDMNLY